VVHSLAEKSPDPLLTGERTWPGVWHENYWFRRHEAGYRWAVSLGVAGTVVEAGVGEGYGATALTRAGADRVVGLDLDPVVLAHVARSHPATAPVRANLVHLPLRSGSVDLVVSAQTVEHLWDQHGFVAECARVLLPGGRLVLTTPNRATFPPGNPFHSRELDASELAALVAPALQVTTLAGLHHGARLAGADRDLAEHGGLVAAQLRTTYDRWDDGLTRTVRSVTADDFAVGGSDGSLDLLLVATAP
jgi:SAM-dependent methyltransferase